ncbi:MAG: hydrolase Nlp/P60 [Caulobacteraceae bacterium]|nr:hydrolase Nlp/P60 [Caulobacteraceae bacterium]
MADDSRTLLMRDGVAAGWLEGLIEADSYVDTTPWRCVTPAAAIRKTPESDAQQQDQITFGEAFDVLALDGAFAFGQARRDGYVGYVYRAALMPGLVEPTHWISALRTYAFSKPDLKSAPVGLYTLNSLVRVKAEEGHYVRAQGTGWLIRDHLTPIGVVAEDGVALAEAFRHAPYQWGGRESAGLDCSGLVQQALYAEGKAGPRDTDQQASLIGIAVAPEALRRGDLVFWRGHVAMMLDANRILHANAHHMATEIELLAQAVARIGAAGGGEPVAYRRP